MAEPDYGPTTSIWGVRAIRATAEALCVAVPGLDGDRWVPQSLIHQDSEVWMPGQQGLLVVPEWWAMREQWVQPVERQDSRPNRPVPVGAGVVLFACSRGRSRHRCSCGADATKQCDYPVVRNGVVVTCDAHVCAKCATNVAPEKDLCPPHARRARPKPSPIPKPRR